MDEDSLSSLILIVLLIALRALLALAYSAFINSPKSSLQEQSEAGNGRARALLYLVAAPVRLRLTYQLASIVLHFVIAALAAASVAQSILENLRADGSMIASLWIYLAVLLPTLIVTVILGNVVPTAAGNAYAEPIALWSVYPARIMILLLAPAVRPLFGLRRVLLAAFGASAMLNVVTEEEIMTLIDASQKGGEIESGEKQMIYSVLQLNDTLAREVMVPRIDIVDMDINTPLEQARKAFIDSGHSRIPVYEDSIDNVKGLLYAKDLLALWDGETPSKGIGDMLRPAYFVHETKPADELLNELKKRKVHLTMVVDEYGGTAGLVTIEDLLEEIVGEIQDEYDIHEEAEYTQQSPNEYTINGSMDLDDLNNLLQADLPTEDSDTLGGFIYTQLGRVPEVGETLEAHHLRMHIKIIEGRRIRKVAVTVLDENDTAQDETTEETITE